MATAPDMLVCPLKLMRGMVPVARGDGDDYILRGFIGRWVITSPERTAPGPNFISYA